MTCELSLFAGIRAPKTGGDDCTLLVVLDSPVVQMDNEAKTRCTVNACALMKVRPAITADEFAVALARLTLIGDKTACVPVHTDDMYVMQIGGRVSRYCCPTQPRALGARVKQMLADSRVTGGSSTVRAHERCIRVHSSCTFCSIVCASNPSCRCACRLHVNCRCTIANRSSNRVRA
jgi:hypothetical protein